jgi:hypothetical protein
MVPARGDNSASSPSWLMQAPNLDYSPPAMIGSYSTAI